MMEKSPLILGGGGGNISFSRDHHLCKTILTANKFVRLMFFFQDIYNLLDKFDSLPHIVWQIVLSTIHWRTYY